MTTTLEHASPLLKIIVIGALLIGIIFALIGVWLVFLGATGETEFLLFGQHFKSLNVGIAAVFIGGVIAATTLRRAFKTIELGMNHSAATESNKARERVAVSGKQRELLSLIASNSGIYVMHIESILGLDRESIVYRARDLESQGYITSEYLTDLAYEITEKGLDALKN